MVKKQSKTDITVLTSGVLLKDLRELIEQERSRVARHINTDLVLLNWNVGDRIRREILREERAEYGKQVVEALGVELSREYGRAFERSALFRMVQFAEIFPDEKIVATLSRQLGWSHFKELLPIQHDLKRTFYADMCLIEGWSVRTLKDKIRRMLFERTRHLKNKAKWLNAELSHFLFGVAFLLRCYVLATLPEPHGGSSFPTFWSL